MLRDCFGGRWRCFGGVSGVHPPYLVPVLCSPTWVSQLPGNMPREWTWLGLFSPAKQSHPRCPPLSGICGNLALGPVDFSFSRLAKRPAQNVVSENSTGLCMCACKNAQNQHLVLISRLETLIGFRLEQVARMKGSTMLCAADLGSLYGFRISPKLPKS